MHAGEIPLRLGVTLRCSKPKQLPRLGKVYRSALALDVHYGEIVQRPGIASLRSALKPLPCPNNAQTGQHLDSTSMALRCSKLKQPPRLALAAVVHDGESILRIGVASLSSVLKAPPCQGSRAGAVCGTRSSVYSTPSSMTSARSNKMRGASTPLAGKASNGCEDSDDGLSICSMPSGTPSSMTSARSNTRREASTPLAGKAGNISGNNSGTSSAVSSPQRRRLDGSSGAHGSTPSSMTSARSDKRRGASSGTRSSVYSTPSSLTSARSHTRRGASSSTTSARSNERRRASTPLAGKAGNLRRRLGVSSGAHGGAQSKNEAHSAIVKMHQIGPLCNSQTSSQCQVADRPVERHRFHQ